ncbi:MAG: phosphoenolpyruvate--protein phosphotransferase [Lachnospiraceae bacterium]|nr:phosphoenolpyruvate--protein phosphotransferase [Lachnospiraceae bacterium]
MTEFTGKAVFGGIAVGLASVYRKKDSTVEKRKVEDSQKEWERFEEAVETAKEELQALYDRVAEEAGEESAMVFEVHQMMLEDDDYLESIEDMIKEENLNAEYAVSATGDSFAEMFSEMEDEYMQGRAADIKDVSSRVVRILSGGADETAKSDVPVILLADDLAPSETVQLDKSKILSFVTRFGSTNSHTSILARTMNIPALIGVDFPEDADMKEAIVDGFVGKLILEPDEKTLEHYRELLKKEEEKRELLEKLKGKENKTIDGREIRLFANIGSVSDVSEVLKNDAGGIGLFRSEFLYLESSDYPTEEEQFKAYKTVAEKMEGREVIIRTLDIGADKSCDYFGIEKEDNPALGYRAIRICLDRTDVFKTQLRAIYRASRFGCIGIMFPMIISVGEVKQIKEIVEEVKASLKEEGHEFGEVELGIMVETPAAVFMSEELAEEVDFFSIGTNDLTQYTLAIDRQNARLEKINDPHHPAVLRAIETTIKNGHKHGAWVGICGELAADTSLTETFLRMGVDELSVSPSRVLSVRDAIRKTDLSK